MGRGAEKENEQVIDRSSGDAPKWVLGDLYKAFI
jgi:hypothetical protein